MKFNFGKKITAAVIAFCMIMFQGLLVPVVQAGMVSTGTAVEKAQYEFNKETIRHYLSQDKAKQVFKKMGVSQELIEQRIAQMTPEELVKFNQEAEKQPAGASIVGLVILVAAILFITDLFGVTDVYPFVNEI